MRPAAVLAKLREEGPRGLARRAARRAYRDLGAAELDRALLPGDVADSGRLDLPPGRAADPDAPLRVGWVTTPPSAGSGGHTTMFRMVRALEEAGHHCSVLLYDRHHGLLADAEAVVRRHWPDVAAEVRDVDDGLHDLDVVVATGWETAHVIARRGEGRPLHRMYFIQDYEPWFYAHGSERELAVDSYRFGFDLVALGDTVHDQLRDDLGLDSHVVPFSCDTRVYRLLGTGARNGVVCYAKPDVPRRGWLQASAALAEVHARRPDQQIHLFGHHVPDLPFPATQHGRLDPAELNALYNRCAAGLGLSYTNVSLVPEEMLAAGCVPVANEVPGARGNLPSPHVVWSGPTPGSIADALCAALEHAEAPGTAAAAAASVRRDNWTGTGAALVSWVEQVARGRATPVAARHEEMA